MQTSDSYVNKIENFYWQHWPYDWRPGQIWYRFKCFLWHRYSTVRPRYLPHTWCDLDTLLPHTMFEILSRFIEKECSPGPVEWYGEHGHKVIVDGIEVYARDEMQNLYDWWHKDYIIGYPIAQDAIWGAVEEDWPILNRTQQDDHYTWNPFKYKTKAAQELWHQQMQAITKLELDMEAELLKRMHRLINLMPYMWT